ncbi:hypothetical protein QQS21_001932 [Conoideocrella luteorostrata]|uniref:Rhodopsin domain-containing protein n=1 Tax=Conoideocrella luteorostrata TaxID=1105319 RepID=A0AAJ0CZ98_9HYPO|nr:hypothetical protein QQS21_001932 [Conoideocrella luteorostrata]
MSIPPGIDLCQYPALQPPAGHTPEFDNPSVTLAPTLVGVSSIMAAWATIFVAARVWLGFRRMDVADYLAVVGLTTSLALMSVIFTTLKYMRHQWDVRACWFDGQYMKLNFIIQMFIPVAFFSSKAAILLLLRQIFGVTRPMRIAIWAGLIFCFLIYFQNLILVPVFSVPRAGETWDDLVALPVALNRVRKMTSVGVEQGALAVLLDLYIFLLPLPQLANLKLRTGAKRLKLFGVFGTAVIGVVASMIGLVFRIRSLSVKDITWANAQLYPCVLVEVYVAIIVSCMPSFAHLMFVIIPESPLFQSLSSRFGRRESSASRERQFPSHHMKPRKSSSSSSPSGYNSAFARAAKNTLETSTENLARSADGHMYKSSELHEGIGGSGPRHELVNSPAPVIMPERPHQSDRTGIVVTKSYRIEKGTGQVLPQEEV